MAHPHAYQIACRLPNGMVLIAGGLSNSGATANAEIYDPTNWNLGHDLAHADESRAVSRRPGELRGRQQRGGG